MIVEIGWVLAGLGLGVFVLLQILRDRRKVLREETLWKELRDVELVNRELWDALGPEHYAQLVYFYLRGRETLVRADFVFGFWEKAARSYAKGLVNRRRFRDRFAPKCTGYWTDYADLIRHFAVKEPARIAAWRRLNRDCSRHVERELRRIERVKTAA